MAATRVQEYVHRGRANSVDWALHEDGAPTLGIPTGCRLELTPAAGGTPLVLDTTTVGTVFRWGTEATWDAGAGLLRLALGGLSALALPLGTYTAAVVIYTGGAPSGVRWGRTQRVSLAVEAT